MDLIVTHDLPAQLIALKQEELDEAMALCERAHFLQIGDPESADFADAFAKANALYREIQTKEKALDGGRLDIGRKLLAVKKQLDDSVKAATEPLADQRARLGNRIAAADAALRELHARRQREAEEAARKEEERLRAEAEAKRLAEHAKAIEEAPPWEAPPQLEPLDGQAIVRPVAPAYVPPPPKSAVRSVTRKVLKVTDPTKIPRDIAGTPLWVLDTKTVERLLRAGIVIPGAELVAETSTAAAGARA